jgi:hypothetical protein
MPEKGSAVEIACAGQLPYFLYKHYALAIRAVADALNRAMPLQERSVNFVQGAHHQLSLCELTKPRDSDVT